MGTHWGISPMPLVGHINSFLVFLYFLPPNNAPSPPHECNATIVQRPVKLLSCFSHQHKTLSIRDNLGCIQSLLKEIRSRNDDFKHRFIQSCLNEYKACWRKSYLSDMFNEFLFIACVFCSGGSLKLVAGTYSLGLKWGQTASKHWLTWWGQQKHGYWRWKSRVWVLTMKNKISYFTLVQY